MKSNGLTFKGTGSTTSCGRARCWSWTTTASCTRAAAFCPAMVSAMCKVGFRVSEFQWSHESNGFLWHKDYATAVGDTTKAYFCLSSVSGQLCGPPFFGPKTDQSQVDTWTATAWNWLTNACAAASKKPRPPICEDPAILTIAMTPRRHWIPIHLAVMHRQDMKGKLACPTLSLAIFHGAEIEDHDQTIISSNFIPFFYFHVADIWCPDMAMIFQVYSPG